MGLLRRTTIFACLGGCASDIAVDLSQVDGPRLLAVAATPAEAAPKDSVTLTALVVDEQRGRADTALAWGLCVTRRPLAELGPVADACIDERPDARIDLGIAPRVVAEIPDDACRLFGPDPPPAQPGQSQARPVDPDRTGGYYQPVIVEGMGELATSGVRIDCGVAGATQAQAAELRMRHRDNIAPLIEQVAITGHPPSDTPERVVRIDVGELVELRVDWPDCAPEQSCAGAEWYPRFDPVSLEIVESREAISVAWYATAGALDDARTGRDVDDPDRYSENTWTAPDEPGRVTLWIVLRDDRGGTSWRTITVDVAAE